jgi:hypothetical protein
MNSIKVSTKAELESAKDKKYSKIIVTGELADSLKKTKKIAYISGVAIAALIAAIAATPFTGGISGAVGLTAAAAFTGVEIGVIILAASVGITLIVAVFKDYDEISYENGKMVLKRKS